jgi:hypothetical protein
MPTSKKSFDHVKGILDKLDRSIDAARDRRLAGTDEEETIGKREAAAAEDAPIGRARPMKRASYFRTPGENPPSPASSEQWPRQKPAD